jgi:hypothetical protein
VLILTGREARTLPPPVVRGLIWRAYVERALPLVRASKLPVSFDATVQQKLDHADLVMTGKELEAELYPDG